MAIDADKLQEFLGRFIADLGATVAAGNDQPSLHRRMAARAGSGRVRAVRPAGRHLLNDRGAGVRAGQPGRRRLQNCGDQQPVRPVSRRACRTQIAATVMSLSPATRRISRGSPVTMVIWSSCADWMTAPMWESAT